MRIRLLIVAALLSSSLYASADTYQYTDYISPGYGGGMYSFDSNSILSVETTILASSFTYSSDPSAISLTIDPNSPVCPSGNRGGEACVEIKSSGGDGFEGFNGPFDAPGTYYNLYGGESLTITDLTPASPAVTPEPSSIALLGTGLLMLVGTLRRRYSLN
jgi:hypothetical protein